MHLVRAELKVGLGPGYRCKAVVHAEKEGGQLLIPITYTRDIHLFGFKIACWVEAVQCLQKNVNVLSISRPAIMLCRQKRSTDTINTSIAPPRKKRSKCWMCPQIARPPPMSLPMSCWRCLRSHVATDSETMCPYLDRGF